MFEEYDNHSDIAAVFVRLNFLIVASRALCRTGGRCRARFRFLRGRGRINKETLCPHPSCKKQVFASHPPPVDTGEGNKEKLK